MIRKKRNISTEKLARVAKILKTIAHPTRLAILEELEATEPLSVSEIRERTQIEATLLSHHLNKMKDRGVLKSERQGKQIFYRLVDRHITKIFDCMESCNLI